ncbi:MAG: peptidylprolyl isomerase, partial [Candidatus Electrothrix sp.]
AEKVLAEALHLQDKQFGFTELINRYSDKHHAYEIGDTGFFAETGGLADADPEFVDKAFKAFALGKTLSKKGAVADKLLETSFGFHIVMPVGRRSAFHREFSEVTREIERKIHQEIIAADKKAYVQRLNRAADVAIDRDRVKELSRTVYKK